MSTIELVLNQPWVARLGWTLVHFLWQGTVIAVLLAAARALAGRWLTDQGRYVLACLALGIMTIAPLVTFLVAGNLGRGVVPAPVWQVPGGDAWERALPWLVVAWASGVGVFSARLIGGWRLTARLRSVAVGPAPREWQQTLEELIHRLRVSAPVRLLTSSLVAVPTVVGWLRPVILVPVEALRGLPIEQVRALLAHELAHIRRHDYLVNIVQSIAEAVLFYHPAVWWISDQIRTERELCCDDVAVAASGDVMVYALALADLDSRRRARLKAALAADGGSLVNRIRRLVGQSQPLSHTLPGPGAAWALALLWVAGIGVVTVHGAPDGSPHPASFVPPAYELPNSGSAAPVLLEPPPAIQIPAAAPVLTALLFDPFLAQLKAPAPSPAGATQPKKAHVEGTVVSLAGDPVKKATVRLVMIGGQAGQRPMAYSETSDDAGKFVIEDVPPGPYTLSASKTGFVEGSYGARSATSPGAILTVNEGATLKNLQITLTPQGIIAGRVTDQDGEPVAQSGVRLYRHTYVRGRKQLEMELRGRGQTNSQGRFSLSNIAPGRYYLAAGAGDSFNAEPGKADLTTYYPNASDAEGAVPLDVTAGARLDGIDVRLRRERIYTVKGKLLLNGAPVKQSMLAVMPASGGSITAGTAWLAEVFNGAFTLRNMGPGNYAIQVIPGGVFQSMLPYEVGLSGRLEFTVKDSDLDGVVLAAGPPVELTGSLTWEGGGDSAGSGNAASPVFLPSFALAAYEGFAQGTAPTRANEDGSFHLKPAGAGRYLLSITGLPQDTYVKSVRYGAQDVTHSPLNLLLGGGSLEIVLSRKAARVMGALRDDEGKLMAGVLVTVWPKTPDPGSASYGIKSVNTDQNGTFTIGGLAPGDYYVAAWDEIDAGLTQTPEFLGAFRSQAAEVKLEEGSRSSVDVKMISSGKIAAEAAKLR